MTCQSNEVEALIRKAAPGVGASVAPDWPSMSLILDGGPPRGRAGSVAVSPAGARGHGAVRTHTGRHVASETCRIPESFAHRTYAPATDASRSGAGAGQEGRHTPTEMRGNSPSEVSIDISSPGGQTSRGGPIG